MKITLINPPAALQYPTIPLGLANIAAYLEKNKIDVDVIDAWGQKLTYDGIKERVNEIRPDVVGITTMSTMFNYMRKTARAVRELLPDVKIVLGGTHPTSLPGETLEHTPEADICVIGEGEQVMLNLLKALEENTALEEVKGIAFRQNRSKIVFTRPHENDLDMDELPLPARHLFPMGKYNIHAPYGKKRPCYTLITSRGCPYSCTYCSKAVFGRKFRAMSPGRVIEEIIELKEKYGARELRFYDDVFTQIEKRTMDICKEMISRKLNLLWSCTTRVDLVNSKLLKLMKKAGCWLITYGVESGNQQVLDNINKKYTVEQALKAFDITNKAGIRTAAFFMVGLPGETRENISTSITLSKRLNPDYISFSIYNILPGSKLYREVVQKDNNYDFFARMINKKSNDSRYLIDEDAVSYDPTPLTDLSLTELNNEVQRAYREFYYNPKYILSKLLSMRSFREFVIYLKAGLNMAVYVFKNKK